MRFSAREGDSIDALVEKLGGSKVELEFDPFLPAVGSLETIVLIFCID